MKQLPRRATTALLSLLLGVGMVVATAPAAQAASAPELTSLSLSEGLVSIQQGVHDYNITVSHATTTLTITPTASDPSAEIRFDTVSGTPTIASGGSYTYGVLGYGVTTSIVMTVLIEGDQSPSYLLNVTRPVAPPTTNAELSSLAVSEGTLTPAFTSATMSYTVDVPYTTTSMEVTASAVDPDNIVHYASTAGMTGNTTRLSVMSNLVVVTVITPDSTRVLYTIHVNRAAAPTALVELESLSVSGGALTPAFDPTVTSYTVAVPYAARFVDLAAAASATSDPHTLTINNAPLVAGMLTVPVNYSGGSSFAVTLTPTNGANAKIYTVQITRDPPSANADLTGLSVADGSITPAFSNAEADYTMTVPYLTTTTSITSTSADATAIIRVNGHDTASGAASAPTPLAVGANTITVEVTAEDGVTTTTRTITVTREAPNLDLSALTVTGGTLSPSFDAGTTTYTMVVPYTVPTVDVAASAAEADWILEIEGAETNSSSIALPVGASTITVMVTALYGESREYTIAVTREEATPAEFGFDLGFGAGDTAAGSPVTANGAHLLAGSTATITMHSSPVVIASGTVLADGTIVLSATLPAGVEPGAHRLVFEGVAEDGSPVTGTAWFTVLRNGTIGAVSLTGPVAYVEALVLTGADSGTLSLLGALLLLSGAGAFVGSRMRTRRA